MRNSPLCTASHPVQLGDSNVSLGNPDGRRYRAASSLTGVRCLVRREAYG